MKRRDHVRVRRFDERAQLRLCLEPVKRNVRGHIQPCSELLDLASARVFSDHVQVQRISGFSQQRRRLKQQLRVLDAVDTGDVQERGTSVEVRVRGGRTGQASRSTPSGIRRALMPWRSASANMGALATVTWAALARVTRLAIRPRQRKAPP